MTQDLRAYLRDLIDQDGPINVSAFMQLCLNHPTYGYYTNGKPIGKSGDFITAPEISQLFGELIGGWVADTWQRIGAPFAFSLIEPGPGRGSLMADILRTLKGVSPACYEAAHINLIEINDFLIQAQISALSDYSRPIHHRRSLDETGGGPFILIANEFLDVLPIRQFVCNGSRYYERVIGLNPDREPVFGQRPFDGLPSGAPDPKKQTIEPGSVYETCEAADALIENLVPRMQHHESAALFIDYGRIQPDFGDTLQAVRSHQKEDVLASPGQADLTAHVDFASLAKGAEAHGLGAHLTTQGSFLLELGLLERAGALGAGLSENGREKIRDAVERLAGPEQMGDLFKVMALTSRSVEPYGFN